jgi:tetratricopeptide (TPR) repeat protein
MVFSLGVLVLAVWVLYQNVVSLQYQRMAREDNLRERNIHPASFILEGFPPIPNLTCSGEPIAVNKARYLIGEDRFREAITLLKSDNSSPYDSRRDYFISMSYDKLGMADSAIYWGLQAYHKQPLYDNLVLAISSRMFIEGRKSESMKILGDYLSKIKTNPNVWMLSARQYFELGKKKQAMRSLDSLKTYVPNDTATAEEYRSLYMRIRIYPFEPLFTKALAALNGKKYQESLTLFTEFIRHRPGIAEAYHFRALGYFQVGKFSDCVSDINRGIRLGSRKSADLINLRGVCNHKLGFRDQACLDFSSAMKLGNKQAAVNYKTFCEKK